MKHIKSRLSSCLMSDLLNALMQVAVNGPPVFESLPVVEIAVQWNLDLTKSLGTGQICSLNRGHS